MQFFIRQAAKFKRHRDLGLISGAGIVFSLAGYAWLFWKLNSFGQTIVMHFNNLEGINQYGRLEQLLWLGGFGLILNFINLILTMELADRDMLLAKIVAGANIFLGILLFIAFAAIIGVN